MDLQRIPHVLGGDAAQRGARARLCAVDVAWLKQRFDADLVIEDHDLHHCRGWRRAHNYGKQSMVWDRLFGTARKRVEGVRGNVDYDKRVEMPLF